jgi:hypothetical protein
MKFNARSFAIIAAILVLSIGFGFAFDSVATAIEKKQYPLSPRYAKDIREVAEQYGVPEVIIWATVCTESGFASNLEGKNGGIGLMQLTPAEFAMIQTDVLGVTPEEAGRLYDPQKNLECGAAYLSYLYQRYGVWETVFAAFDAGTETVDAWLASPDYVNDLGMLKTIPDAKTARFVRDVMKARERRERAQEKQDETVIDRMAARSGKQGIDGLNFAVTGGLVLFANREELKAYIAERGGKLLSAMSAKTDYLITNDTDSGSAKNKKAAELGIEIITESEFLKMTQKK